MTELAARALISRSGMTRRVARLVDEGLVRRAIADADARGVVVALTDAGVARLTETAPIHLRGVSELFVEQLDDTGARRSQERPGQGHRRLARLAESRARLSLGGERAGVPRPSPTHLASSRLVRTSSGSTLSHPSSDRPRISMGRAFVEASARPNPPDRRAPAPRPGRSPRRPCCRRSGRRVRRTSSAPSARPRRRAVRGADGRSSS